MDNFESTLNTVLIETFNHILKYEEVSLKKVLDVPVTIAEAHMVEAIGSQEHKEATVSKIATLLGIAMPTATIAVKKLEKKGFIKKASSEKDGRCSIISLTDMGRRIEKIHHLFHEKMVRNISNQFLSNEKETLLSAMEKLNDFFKERVEA